MLRELRVGNLALVEDLNLNLGPGLTMLTGETGAGKSLIAGALSLLTGVRADRGLIRAGEDLAWVEGLFDLAERPVLAAYLAQVGVRLAADAILVLRRELRREGRGRVLINGLTSSLALLEDIGPRLLAIQSQDQQRLLSKPSFAMEFLDRALGLEAEVRRVRDARAVWLERVAELKQRRQEAEFARQQLEMWEYQHRELAGMGLAMAEEEELAEQLAFGRNARSMLAAADKARNDLTEGAPTVQELLGGAESALAAVSHQSARLAEVLTLIQNAGEAVAEASQGLERFLSGAVVDPAQLDEMEARKAQYEDMRRKYGCDVAGLLALQESLAVRIERQKSADQSIDSLTEAVAAAQEDVAVAALDLRRKRLAGAPDVASEAMAVLRPLALPEIEVQFVVAPRPGGQDGVPVGEHLSQVTTTGADTVQLLVRTNRGEASGPVGMIASGGEKSRIFLGLSVLAGYGAEQPLLLFDEIDAGLGMDNAIPVAELLVRLATAGQVLCITHLATVAARGQAHLKAGKSVSGERTILKVKPLADDERLAEIERLLGGRETDTAGAVGSRLAYARQLLGQA